MGDAIGSSCWPVMSNRMIFHLISCNVFPLGFSSFSPQLLIRLSRVSLSGVRSPCECQHGRPSWFIISYASASISYTWPGLGSIVQTKCNMQPPPNMIHQNVQIAGDRCDVVAARLDDPPSKVSRVMTPTIPSLRILEMVTRHQHATSNTPSHQYFNSEMLAEKVEYTWHISFLLIFF
jgi:hypothetical protein